MGFIGDDMKYDMYGILDRWHIWLDVLYFVFVV